MPKVTMTKTTPGSPDGIRVITYKEGEGYDLPDNLAKAFVEDMKVAEYAGRRAQPAPAVAVAVKPAIEAKMETGAPENKADKPADESKAAGEEEQPAAEAPIPTKSPARGASPRRG